MNLLFLLGPEETQTLLCFSTIRITFFPNVSLLPAGLCTLGNTLLLGTSVRSHGNKIKKSFVYVIKGRPRGEKSGKRECKVVFFPTAGHNRFKGNEINVEGHH